jgi:hypothetical protein
MMVGHTHDDVDQMFSRFSVGIKLHHSTIVSIKHFFTVLGASFNPSPRCEFMFRCNDWKSWLDNFSTQAAGGNDVHGHTRPHQFHFLFQADDVLPRMLWKKWARDINWCPVNPDTPPVYLLAKDCSSFDNLSLVVPRTPDEEIVQSVFKNFNIAKTQVSLEEFTTQMEHLQHWMSADHVEPNSFKPMPPGFAWNHHAGEREEKFDGEESSRSVTREDISTSDEDLVYQGKRHSQDVRRTRFKGNFVNVDDVVVDQLLLVRGEKEDGADDIWLCKVKDIVPESRALKVQWYGGKSINHAQHPEMAADTSTGQGGSKGKKKKNKIFYQEISLDTVLVSEAFKLTQSKTVPAAKIRLAERRLEAMRQYNLNQTTRGNVHSSGDSN